MRIVNRGAGILKLKIDEAGACKIATRSRGT